MAYLTRLQSIPTLRGFRFSRKLAALTSGFRVPVVCRHGQQRFLSEIKSRGNAISSIPKIEVLDESDDDLDADQKKALFSGEFPTDYSGEAIHIRVSKCQHDSLVNAFFELVLYPIDNFATVLICLE